MELPVGDGHLVAAVEQFPDGPAGITRPQGRVDFLFMTQEMHLAESLTQLVLF
jgi:hypothetical protein